MKALKKITKKALVFIQKNKYIDRLILFFLTFPVYLNNLSASVFGGDAGDFLTAILTRGVPHPSGYPLFTMLGILASHLPISATPAWKVGSVSVLFSSLAIVVYYQIVYELTSKRLISILTSLILAFTYPFWLYAEIVEVFALNSFLITVLIYLTIKYTKSKENKYLYLLAFFTGLSLTNNLSIVLIFPAIVLVILLSGGKLVSFKLFLKSFFLLLLGLSPYLYVIIAASSFPKVNWGFAVNLENFVHLVSRKLYGWDVNKAYEKVSLDNLSYRLKLYIDYWKGYINPILPFLGLSGAVYLIIRKRWNFFFLFFVSFILTGPFFIVYAGREKYFGNFLTIGALEKFLIANFIVFFLFTPFSIIFFKEILNKLPIRKFLKKTFIRLTYLIFFLPSLSSFIVNFNRLNFKNVNIGDNLAIDILSSLPPGSVLLLRADSLAFNSLYYQYAYDFRKDVEIPGIYEGYDVLLKSLDMSEGEILDHKIKNKGLIKRDSVYAAIGPLLTKRQIFADWETEIIDDHFGKITTVPYGLLYKFEFEKNLPYPKEKYTEKVQRILETYHLKELEEKRDIISQNLILADIQKIYSLGLLKISIYLASQYNENELAKNILDKSLQLDPLFPDDFKSRLYTSN